MDLKVDFQIESLALLLLFKKFSSIASYLIFSFNGFEISLGIDSISILFFSHGHINNDIMITPPWSYQ